MRMPYPDSIRDAPELHPGLSLFMDAFQDLDGSRINGMSLGRIPWMAISEYCDRLEIIDDQREDVIFQVQALDTWYLGWVKSKNA